MKIICILNVVVLVLLLMGADFSKPLDVVTIIIAAVALAALLVSIFKKKGK